MAKETKKKDSDSEVKLVSFKMAADKYAELEKYAQDQRDYESGVTLSAAQYARRLVLEALDRLRKKP